MSKWDDFCAGVSRTTKTTASKTKHIANLTSLKVKLGGLEGKVSEEYDTLGRIYYMQVVGKVESADAIRNQIKIISDINKQINAVNAEIRELKRVEAEEKAAREAEKEARKAAREAEKAAAEAASEEEEKIEEEVEAEAVKAEAISAETTEA